MVKDDKKHVGLAIAALESHRSQLQKEMTRTNSAIAVLKKLRGPSQENVEGAPSPARPTRKIKNKRIKRLQRQEPSRQDKKLRSRYRGVEVRESKRKGLRFTARPFDKSTKKQLNRGVFDIEELAAAEVEEFFGNKKEAQRLRDMAEQAKNNPDRPKRRRRARSGKSYRCNHCGVEFQTKPLYCPGCNSASFSEQNSATVKPQGRKD